MINHSIPHIRTEVILGKHDIQTNFAFGLVDGKTYMLEGYHQHDSSAECQQSCEDGIMPEPDLIIAYPSPDEMDRQARWLARAAEAWRSGKWEDNT